MERNKVRDAYLLGYELSKNHNPKESDRLYDLVRSFSKGELSPGQKSLIANTLHTVGRHGIDTWGKLMESTPEDIDHIPRVSYGIKAFIQGLTGVLVEEEEPTGRIRLSVALATTLKLMRGEDVRMRGRMSLREATDQFVAVLEKGDQTKAVVLLAAAVLDSKGLKVKDIQGLTLEQALQKYGMSEARFHFFKELFSKE
jgi:hypothetical protein